MVFWGKVEGNENDYLVCYALVTPTLEEGDFPLKKVRQKTKICFSVPSYCTPINASSLSVLPLSLNLVSTFLLREQLCYPNSRASLIENAPPPLLKKMHKTRAMVAGRTFSPNFPELTYYWCRARIFSNQMCEFEAIVIFSPLLKFTNCDRTPPPCLDRKITKLRVWKICRNKLSDNIALIIGELNFFAHFPGLLDSQNFGSRYGEAFCHNVCVLTKGKTAGTLFPFTYLETHNLKNLEFLGQSIFR